MHALIFALVGTASAQDPIAIAPEVVRFGWQPFGSSTLRRFTMTNESVEPLLVSVDSVRVGDDFSPGQVVSTCPLTQPTLLLPGESCFHAVGFQPSEFFGGREVALMRVTARDPDDMDPVLVRRVRLTGTGYADGDRVVDLSDNGPGPLDPGAFDEDGIRFAPGEVALVEGDDALLGPVAFTTPDDPRGVVVTFAPADPGTAWYQLSAVDADGDLLAWTRMLVAQDPGDPAAGPPGYVEIELVDVPEATAVVTLTSLFVSSSDPAATGNDFGVASVALFDQPLP